MFSSRLIKLFKIENVDFIYERASYLNFSGLIACRYLGIPHFYESNGLQFESRKNIINHYLTLLLKDLKKYFIDCLLILFLLVLTEIIGK